MVDRRLNDPKADANVELSLLDILQKQKVRLKRIIAGFGLGRSDADDILQDVSVEALKQERTFECEDRAAAWLIRVTINRCLDQHRKRKRFRRTAEKILRRQVQNSPLQKTPAGAAIEKEELEIMRQVLKTLDDLLLAPLVLRYFCDYNSTQIAGILQLNASTVRSRLRDARMTLAQRLIKKGIQP